MGTLKLGLRVVMSCLFSIIGPCSMHHSVCKAYGYRMAYSLVSMKDLCAKPMGVVMHTDCPG